MKTISGIELNNAVDTQINFDQSTALKQHIWVSSSQTFVQPDVDTMFGINGIFSPPYLAPEFNFRMDMDVNGIFISDDPQGFRLINNPESRMNRARPLLKQERLWQLDKFKRKGNAHYSAHEEFLSFAVNTEVKPLLNEHAVVLEVEIINRESNTLKINLLPDIHPGPIGLQDDEEKPWDYTPSKINGRAILKSENCWEGIDTLLKVDIPELEFEIKGNSSHAFQVKISFESLADIHPAVSCKNNYLKKDWDQIISDSMSTFPTFNSNNENLNNYVKRSLITGFSCVSQFDQQNLERHLMTSGLDGGSTCSYLWDQAYGFKIISLLFPDYAENYLSFMQSKDIVQNNFAFSMSGQGTGPYYASNNSSLMEVIWNEACFRDISKETVEWIKGLIDKAEELLPRKGELLDFGDNENVLEMRTKAYEHFVPCFNTARGYNMKRLAKLMDLKNISGAESYLKTADKIITEVRNKLWSEKEKWFCCMDEAGDLSRVDSIQIFDALRWGAADACQQDLILKRICDGDFLGRYGVHSISPQDTLHYEVIDTDWSGNGCFTGDAQNLVETLYEIDKPDLAWKVLQRLLWMGELLPTYPQQHHAGKPQAGERGRPNIIAGLAGAQAVIFGMLGIDMRPNGNIKINPRLPEGLELELNDFQFRDKSFAVKSSGDICEIKMDNQVIEADKFYQV
ncbi:MAG: MGH1-like glycoside hydrolase domain-containing protein [Planctomycetota bacterium]